MTIYGTGVEELGKRLRCTGLVGKGEQGLECRGEGLGRVDVEG